MDKVRRDHHDLIAELEAEAAAPQPPPHDNSVMNELLDKNTECRRGDSCHDQLKWRGPFPKNSCNYM